MRVDCSWHRSTAGACNTGRVSCSGLITSRERRLLAIVVACYLALASGYAIVVPPFEAPDEPAHLLYTNFVAQHAQLPNQDAPARRVAGEGHQFPLYYIGAALLVRLTQPDNAISFSPQVNRSAEQPAMPSPRPKFLHTGEEIFTTRRDAIGFYLLRILSIAFGAATVITGWLIARMLVSRAIDRLTATALIATLPQFAFISATINNDNLANLLIALAIYALLRVLSTPEPGNFLLLGLTLGPALATKKTALFVVPVVIGGVAWLWWQRRQVRRNLLKSFAVTTALVALSAGWVFARNALVYRDPLGNAMERRTLPELLDHKSIVDPYWFNLFLPRMAESFVATFGWMDVRLPGPLFAGYMLVAVLSVAGFGVAAVRIRWDAGQVAALALVASCFAGVVIYNLTYTQFQGRFLFPVLPLIAIGCVAGLRQSCRLLGRERHVGWVALACVGQALVVNAIALLSLHRFYNDLNNYIR
ncbi:MAG: hypothetical protein DCC58_01325 [Chloroflexi bacterium]|nr:MAG: hypothetical protein DCC58_01325 [Chloroflexota bacterium]